MIVNCIYCNESLEDKLSLNKDFISCKCRNDIAYSTRECFNYLGESNILFQKDQHQLYLSYGYDKDRSSLYIIDIKIDKFLYERKEDYFLIEQFKIFVEKLSSPDYQDFIENIELLS